MTDPARLLDGPFSEGLDTVTKLVRCREFTDELGKCIRADGGAERAVRALRQEFLPQPEPVDLAYADWQAEQPKPVEVQQPQGGHSYRGGQSNELPAHHYRVRVNRGPLPPMATLEELYSKDGVSALFNGSYAWTKDRSRLGANDVTADEVVMVAKQFTADEIREMGGLTSENIIAWGLRNDLAVADEKETHAFGINPETRDLQLSRWLVGLGSSTMLGAYRCVALLSSSSGTRILGDYWFDGKWFSGSWFLFVLRK